MISINHHILMLPSGFTQFMFLSIRRHQRLGGSTGTGCNLIMKKILLAKITCLSPAMTAALFGCVDVSLIWEGY